MVKNLPANAGDMGSIPRSGRCPGEGNGNLFPGVWHVTVHGVAKSQHTHAYEGAGVSIATSSQVTSEGHIWVRCFTLALGVLQG